MSRIALLAVVAAVTACSSTPGSPSVSADTPATASTLATGTATTHDLIGTWAYDLDRSSLDLDQLADVRLTIEELEADVDGVSPDAGLRTSGTSPCGDGHDGVVAVGGAGWQHRSFGREDAGCPSEEHAVAEQRYEDMLMRTDRWTVEGDVLTLRVGDDRLVYERIPDVDLAQLDGIAWRLRSWTDGNEHVEADGSLAPTILAFHLHDERSGVWSLLTPCLDSYGEWVRRGDSLAGTSMQTIGWRSPEECTDAALTAMNRAHAVDFVVRSMTASTLELGGTHPGDVRAHFEAAGPARIDGPPAPKDERACERGATSYTSDAPWTDPEAALAHFGEGLPPGLTLMGRAIMLGDAQVGSATPETFPDGTVAIGSFEYCVAHDRDLSVSWRP